MREGLKPLVHIDTWRPSGESFEFAHFTDLQLANAIASIDQAASQPTLQARTTHIGQLRAQRSNLKKALWPGASKVDLAEALWPVMLGKVKQAEKRGTVDRIPIVRVLDHATQLANEFTRGGVVIPLKGVPPPA